MSEIDNLREEMALACQVLVKEGQLKAFGHLSARIPQTELFLVTPRMSLALVGAKDLVTVDLEGERIEGENIPPQEIFVHTEIYRHRKDVQAIVRAHPPHCLVFSVLGRAIRPLHGFGSVCAAPVPVFMEPYLIESRALGEALVTCLGEGDAVLLRGNGNAVVGRSVVEACVKALFLEESAAIQYRALCIAEPIFLSPEETRANAEAHLMPRVINRAWDYYKSRLP